MTMTLIASAFADVVSYMAPDMYYQFGRCFSPCQKTVTPEAACFHMAGTAEYFQYLASDL